MEVIAKIIANYLQELEVDYFAVAYVNEGVALRDAGIIVPILVLHPQPVNFKTLIERCLEPNLYNAKVLKEFITVAATSEQQTNYPVHIKFNTGLNRLGFWENDIDYITTKLKETSSVKVKSIFSHLAASEDMNEAKFTYQQIKCFKDISEAFSKAIDYQPMLHMTNTSGIIKLSRSTF